MKFKYDLPTKSQYHLDILKTEECNMKDEIEYSKSCIKEMENQLEDNALMSSHKFLIENICVAKKDIAYYKAHLKMARELIQELKNKGE